MNDRTKPGDTIALWRAAALQTSRWGAKGAERVFTFVCAGYRGRAVGDWPRERRDGGAPGSVTALAAGEAALLARDRGRAVLARFRRGAGNGGILPQTAGVCNGEMRLRAACLPLQKIACLFQKTIDKVTGLCYDNKRRLSGK